MSRRLAYHAERLWSNAARRKEVDHCAKQKGTAVYWIVRNSEWISLRWCHVTEYEAGVIRFTSFVAPAPPKSLWPVDPEPHLTRRLEITLAADELDETKYARLADIFSHPEKALDWELLQKVTSDTNLWSEAAVAVEKRSREERSRQKSR